MERTTVIFAHPDPGNSYANKYIINGLNKRSGIQIRNLTRMYPDFNIDVHSEQRALENSDLIIFQYPIYWYSSPPILNHWMNQVLTYGFAFGKTGTKLKNKKLLISVTTGGAETSYSPTGHNLFSISDMLIPMKQVANHTGLRFLEPISSSRMEYIPDVQNNLKSIESKGNLHVEKILKLIDGHTKVKVLSH